MKARSPCAYRGCPNLAIIGRSYCLKHYVAWEGRRGFEGYKGDYLANRAVTLREEPICRMCGQRPSVTVDHIIPKSRGGSDEPSNLRGACQACHNKRSQQQAKEGRREI